MENQQGKHSAAPPRRRRSRRKRKIVRILRMVLLDLFFVGLGLIVFALFHHVLGLAPQSEPVQLPAATAAVETAPAPVETETPPPAAPEESAPPAEETPTQVYSGV